MTTKFSARSSLYIELGPGSYSGQTFADVCDELILSEAQRLCYDFRCPSDRAGDYKGLDAISLGGESGNFDGFSGTVGFQYKFYPSEASELLPWQRREIKESLKRAKESDSNLRAWILVTPEDFNVHQEEWLNQTAKELKCSFSVKHWGQKELSLLMERYPECVVHLYPDTLPPQRPTTLLSICTRLAQMLQNEKALIEYYIPLKLSSGLPADEALKDFLEQPDSVLFCLFGGYGTGKTTTLQHLTLILAQEFFANRRGVVPLLIRLRHVRGTGSFRQNLVQYVSSEYGLNLDVATLRSLHSRGKILLLFDGLDEKEDARSRQFGRIRLRDVFDFVSPSGKTVVSSRTEFFKDLVEERITVLGHASEHAFSTRDNKVNAIDHRIRVHYLQLLSPMQICNYAHKRLGNKAADFLRIVSSVYDLESIVTRPVILDMTCEALPVHATLEQQVRACDIYRSYVEKQLEEDYSVERFACTIEDRLNAIESLAEHMVSTNCDKVHYSKLAKVVNLPSQDIDRDLLCTSFLLRGPDGEYEFSHRSFLEYFGASRMYKGSFANKQRTAIWADAQGVSDELWTFLRDINCRYWTEELVEEIPFQVLKIDRWKWIGASPMTVEAYRAFVQASGYKGNGKAEELAGFALVPWKDARACCLWYGGDLPSFSELNEAIQQNWPHTELSWDYVPFDSFFAARGVGIEFFISARGMRGIRSRGEWSIEKTLTAGSWMMSQGGPINVRYNVSPSELSYFRCIFLSS